MPTHPHFILHNSKVLTDNQGKDNNTKEEHIVLFSGLQICTNSELSSAFTYALDYLLISVQEPVYSYDIFVWRGTQCPLHQTVNTKDTTEMFTTVQRYTERL